MKLLYVYSGFSLGVALYFLYLTIAGVRTPELRVGVYIVDLFLVVAILFAAFTLYVVYRLRERRS